MIYLLLLFPIYIGLLYFLLIRFGRFLNGLKSENEPAERKPNVLNYIADHQDDHFGVMPVILSLAEDLKKKGYSFCECGKNFAYSPKGKHWCPDCPNKPE